MFVWLLFDSTTRRYRNSSPVVVDVTEIRVALKLSLRVCSSNYKRILKKMSSTVFFFWKDDEFVIYNGNQQKIR